MGWVEDIKGQTVGVDTAPLIYFIETSPKYSPLVDPFFEAVANGELTAVTSTITLLEVLVQPLKLGKADIVAQYREILLSAEGLFTLDVNPNIAQGAAELRAKYNLRTPDAIQIATAIFMGASKFLTNDRRLSRVAEIDVLILEEFFK